MFLSFNSIHRPQVESGARRGQDVENILPKRQQNIFLATGLVNDPLVVRIVIYIGKRFLSDKMEGSSQ